MIYIYQVIYNQRIFVKQDIWMHVFYYVFHHTTNDYLYTYAYHHITNMYIHTCMDGLMDRTYMYMIQDIQL